MQTNAAVHLDLDAAWPPGVMDLPTRELREWGPRLRYLARARDAEAFYREVVAGLPPFVLYGSGDFHFLAGLFARRFDAPRTVVSFDNHPDWDVRPPRWACGGWVNRALETPGIERVSVWGCGNFELAFPSRLFANHRALRSGRLEVHAWAERQSPATARRFNCMTRDDWRERFDRFAEGLTAKNVYVTVDLDCLRDAEAATNWENGLFTADDVAWAIGRLRDHTTVLGGDVCGAASPAAYARVGQRFAGWWDHPRQPIRSPDEARRINAAALQTIWARLAEERNI